MRKSSHAFILGRLLVLALVLPVVVACSEKKQDPNLQTGSAGNEARSDTKTAGATEIYPSSQDLDRIEMIVQAHLAWTNGFYDRESRKKWLKDSADLKNDFDGEPTDFGTLTYLNGVLPRSANEVTGSNDENWFIGEPRIVGRYHFRENFEDYHFPKNVYEFHIVKISYQVVANLLSKEGTSSQITMFPKPTEEVSYLVCMRDSNSGKIKFVDTYPDRGYPAHGIIFASLASVGRDEDLSNDPRIKEILGTYANK